MKGLSFFYQRLTNIQHINCDPIEGYTNLLNELAADPIISSRKLLGSL